MGFRNPILRLSQLIADSITGATITGGIIQTATAGARWVISGGVADQILGYTGVPGEIAPGGLQVAAGSFEGSEAPAGVVTLSGSQFNNDDDAPALSLFSNPNGSAILQEADQWGVQVQGDTGQNAIGAFPVSMSIAPTGVLIGKDTPSSGAINGIDLGAEVVAFTDSAGQVVYTHNLGVLPRMVLVTVGDQFGFVPYLLYASLTADNFTVQFRNTAYDAAPEGAGTRINWVAIA